jgi:hypothetical protein
MTSSFAAMPPLVWLPSRRRAWWDNGRVHAVRSSAHLRYHGAKKVTRMTQEVVLLCPS